MKRLILPAIFFLSLAGCGVQQEVSSGDSLPSNKVFVCKYETTPGGGERLQTGQNPISVSVNAIQGVVSIGKSFSDAQGRSIVIAWDTGQPEPSVSACPPPNGPPGTTTTTEPDDDTPGTTTTTTAEEETTTTCPDCGINTVVIIPTSTTTTTVPGVPTVISVPGATTTTSVPGGTTTTVPGVPTVVSVPGSPTTSIVIVTVPPQGGLPPTK